MRQNLIKIKIKGIHINQDIINIQQMEDIYGRQYFAITISGPPIAKVRARFNFRNGKAVAYDPQEKVKKDQKNNLFLEALRKSYVSTELPIELFLEFHMLIPDSDSFDKRNAKLWGIEHHISKPDCDNLEKFILDVGNEILWKDDRQIVKTQCKKIYSQNPCTKIIITPIHYTMNDTIKHIMKSFNPEEFKELKSLIKTIHSGIEFIEFPINNLSEKDAICSAQSLIDLSKTFMPQLKKLAKYDS